MVIAISYIIPMCIISPVDEAIAGRLQGIRKKLWLYLFGHDPRI